MVLVLLGVYTILSNALEISSIDESCLRGINFYIYGSTNCPYCKSLEMFFESKIPGSSFFCDLDSVEECRNLFTTQSIYIVNNTSLNPDIPELILYKLLGAIPRTLVVRNNAYILGVVIGAVEDLEFWINISCSKPGNKVPLYSGNNLIGYVELNTTDHSKFIAEWLPQRLPSETPKKQFDVNVYPLLIPVIVLIAGIIIAVIARKVLK